jgi:mRNA interferase MazF
MKRGDIVVVALQGDHGKPRPALIVQSDYLPQTPLIAVVLLTSVPRDAPLVRVPIDATPENGLAARSFAMLDRITSADRSKVGTVVGRVDDITMLAVNRALVVFLGLA